MATYTTPQGPSPEDSCHETANVLDDFIGNLPAKPLTETLSEILPMPSLFRFLTVVAVIAGIVYGVVFALANFVNPKPREMTVTIPPDKFLKK